MKIKHIQDNVYWVFSERDARKHYLVEIDTYDEYAGHCTCLSYRFRHGQPCKHILEVRKKHYGLKM